jgi:hypothetical protein
MIQIVATDRGNLAGRYEQVVLQTDGTLARMDAAITGSSDGHTLVLSIKPAEWLSGSFIASGTVIGSALHLTGGGFGSNIVLDLLKKDEAVFQARAFVLARQSEQKIAEAKAAEAGRAAEAQAAEAAQAQEEEARRRAKADADRLATLGDLTKRLLNFTGNARVQLPKFASMEQRYRSITEAMRRALDREQSIKGDSDGSYARAQIASDINEAGLRSDQLHLELQSFKQDFENGSVPLVSLLADAINSCDVHAQDPNQSASEKAACRDLTDAAEKFGTDVDALRQRFVDTEAVWQNERAQQEQIVDRAFSGV